MSRGLRVLRRGRLTRAAVAALTLLAGVVLISACERTEPYGEGSAGPGNDTVSVVKDFITEGVVDHNGYQACVYLTPGQQREAARRAGAYECRQAFDLARLELGGESIQTVHEIDGLAATSSVRGDHARVRLSRGGATVEFRLVKADFAESEQFQAPNTDWRIAGGELPLLPVQRG